MEESKARLLGTPVQKKKHTHEEAGCDIKLVSFFIVGVLTFIYVIGEIGVAIWINSLVLLSDGFHNLSDVVSLYIAYWAQQAGKREITNDMSYGWRRSEVLGGLTNGCFLISLCLYVVLQAIPKFIKPEPIEAGIVFIIVAAVGLGLNTVGTIVFAITGQGHTHSHGGGGGHSHGHGHGHDHKKEKHGSKGEKHEMDGLEEIEHHREKKKPKEEGHSHSHEKGEKKEKKKEKHGHSHGHDHGKKEKKEKKKTKRDMNVHAIFLHYLGDAISSLMVLGAGVLIHFFKGGKWTEYIDPVSSLLIVVLILWTTMPLIKSCSMILLQSTPTDVEVDRIKGKLMELEGVVTIHDFHIWQLVDGLIIASIHIGIEEGVDFTHICSEVKKILHDNGIHSTCIQPEFLPRNFQDNSFCEQNCVKECEEDWCCKKEAQKKLAVLEEYSTKTEL